MSKETIKLDRDTYRSIKKMSREEMENFLMRYSESLLEDNGQTKTLDLPALQDDLRQIKGLGEKRTEEVMKVIEKHLGI